MRVLFIAGSFPPMWCGAGDYVAQLATTLAENPNLKLAVLTSRAAAASEAQGSFDFFPVVEVWRWREITKIFKVLRTWKPDLVHVQYPAVAYGNRRFPYLLPILLCLARLPVVETWHGFYRLGWALRFGYFSRLLFQALAPGGLVVSVQNFREGSSLLMRWVFLYKTVRYIPLASNVPSVELSIAEAAQLRALYLRPNERLIVYFGFIAPPKGVELLFEIADPGTSHLVIIGDSFSKADLGFVPKSLHSHWSAYHQSLRQLAESESWKGRVTMTGFLPPHDAARIMSAADAVVLPFRVGAHENSTSIQAAEAQGTFVLTTSKQRSGYDAERNIYFASPDDLDEMRGALLRYNGTRSKNRGGTLTAWNTIGESHFALYRSLVGRGT